MYSRTMKPVVPTYYPSEIRQQSVGKENRVPVKHNSCSQIRFLNVKNDSNIAPTKDSFDSQKSLEQQLQTMKLQMLQLQNEQNTLNEQFQIQIKSLTDRMSNNEQSVTQLYDTGVGKLNNEIKLKETLKNLELKMGELSLQIINQEQKQVQSFQQQIERVKKYALEQIKVSEVAIQEQLNKFNSLIEDIKKGPENSNCVSLDLQRFQKFNEEVTSYLNSALSPSTEQLNSPINNVTQPVSPPKQQVKNIYKCQMSAISEQTLEDSRIDYQVQQYELDANGYLLSNGTYILDQNGQRYQLSQDQITYLKSINVIEEINT